IYIYTREDILLFDEGSLLLIVSAVFLYRGQALSLN
ncbi:MAG: hypothetical protein ACI90V_010808, partial [Bacillariaceae sp.]